MLYYINVIQFFYVLYNPSKLLHVSMQSRFINQLCIYVGVSESKVPYFFATKILHIIRCLFLQLLLTSFTIFSRSHLLC